jgi:chemotaxis protein MotB
VSDDDDDDAPAAPQKKFPMWLTTFSDLMALLMCFFVLLLSFSEMDVTKFKQVIGKMSKAFGVQRDEMAATSPKGTSIIADEFRPGRPDIVSPQKVMQQTIDEDLQTLDFNEIKVTKIESDINQISEYMKDDMSEESMEVTQEGGKIIIRLFDQDSFLPGSALLKPTYLPMVKKVSGILAASDGEVVIAGHTDDLFIKNDRFRSNWELSASRAVSVAHELLGAGMIKPERIIITGHGSSRPLVKNKDRNSRQKNRRVEIILKQDSDNEVLKRNIIRLKQLPDKLTP